MHIKIVASFSNITNTGKLTLYKQHSFKISLENINIYQKRVSNGALFLQIISWEIIYIHHSHNTKIPTST